MKNPLFPTENFEFYGHYYPTDNVTYLTASIDKQSILTMYKCIKDFNSGVAVVPAGYYFVQNSSMTCSVLSPANEISFTSKYMSLSEAILKVTSNLQEFYHSLDELIDALTMEDLDVTNLAPRVIENIPLDDDAALAELAGLTATRV